MKLDSSFLNKNRCSAHKDNVMHSINWVVGIAEALLTITGATQYDNWYGKGCFIVACVLFIFYLGMFLYFAIRDPDRLQSESYNLEQKRMNYLKAQGTTERIAITDNPLGIATTQNIDDQVS